MRAWETWIALGLLGIAGFAFALPLAPDLDHLEEGCAPPIPEGAPVELDVVDEVTMEEGVATRRILFVPSVAPETIVVRTCASVDAEVVREETQPSVRIVASARGYDPDGLDDNVEVKARAVQLDGTLTIVPRFELHGESFLPHLRIELVAPAGAQARVEAWP